MKYYIKVLQNFANFNGRARRSEYWYFVLINFIITLGITFLGASINIEMLGNIYSIVVLIPSLAVAVRRMHDVNKSGWFILIPIYNLILLFTEGDKGSNQYGPDPKNPEMGIEDHLVEG